MPRKRLIAPEFFKHGALYDAEVSSKLPLRLAFAGLWTQADRRGYFAWKPRELKTDVLPYDPCDMTDVLLALCEHGFITRFARDGHEFGMVPTLGRWQTFHVKEKPNGHIPEPLTQLHGAGTVSAPTRPSADTPVAVAVAVAVTGTGTKEKELLAEKESRRRQASARGEERSPNGAPSPPLALPPRQSAAKDASHDPERVGDILQRLPWDAPEIN